MSIDESKGVRQVRAQRRRCWLTGIAMTGLGLIGLAGGTAYAVLNGVEGDRATIAGVFAGMGFGFVILGAIMAFWGRPGRPIDPASSGEGAQRAQLQSARTRQLVIFPVVMLLFMIQAQTAMQRVLGGDHNPGAYVQILLPVLYGWVIPLIVMGWDMRTRQNRRLMDDELTELMRSRSMILAFVVLMGGITVALGLGLWRADYGVMALPYVLALGGASAGLRFAWLDREAGRDG
ncbi:hypothetical protein SH203_00822 [Brevundimonas sp. SH203]|uniref:hypothetical protein n=1 Tax=Brevundimonas sp. SH203 TaxID=345167 RepID=UPI0009C7BBE0|nr:hypothetical protein [Brevundimonas sp. SH203]GAW40424.1 hypothetical protein SH203_00822 [Brevundimonas sp. SH203]